MKFPILLLLMIFVCAMCAPSVFGTISHTLTFPTDLYSTSTTSMTFNWTATSNETNATKLTGLRSYIYLTPVNNLTLIVNTSALVTNGTSRNVTISGLGVGYYKWKIITNDTYGNSSSVTRWFEIRDSTNETDFKWTDSAGTVAMELNSGTKALQVGTITPWSNNTYNVGSLALIMSSVYTNDIVALDEINASGKLNAPTLNTGQGDNELYDMNQNMLTTSEVTFVTITTTGNVAINGNLTVNGSIINVSYMNPNGSVIPYLNNTYNLGNETNLFNLLWVERIIASGDINTTGRMTSATLNTGQGDNELYDMNQNVQTTDNVTFSNVSATFFNGNGTWRHQSYPAACPANSAVTTIGDLSTCTDGLYTLAQIVTAVGNWSSEKANYLIWSTTKTYIDSVGNWSNEKANYLVTANLDNSTIIRTDKLDNNTIIRAETLDNNTIVRTSTLTSYTTTAGLVNVSVNSSAYWDNLNVPTDITSVGVLSNLDISGKLNMTGTNEVIWFANNASITTNATCLFLRSPNGSNVTAICNI